MKAKDQPFDHKVFLASMIATELRSWRHITGRKGLVFLRHRTRPVMHEALEKALRNIPA